MSDVKVVEFEVPKAQHSRLIGKGGAVIKKLQADSGAIIKIPKQDDPSGKVSIEGTQATIAAAQREMESLLGIKLSTGPLIVRSIDVPKQKHTIIVGKGGSTVKDLQARHGVSIQIPRQEHPSSIITVEGHDQASVLATEKAMEALLGMQFSGKTSALETPEARTSTNQLPKINLDGRVKEAIFMPDTDGSKVQRIIQYLASATKSIDVCVFNITDNRISDVLVEMKHKGVTVRVISDDDQAKTTGSDIASLAARGVAVRIDASPAHMHHKFAILDGKVVLSGSFNWTRQASGENRENVVALGDSELARGFSAEFEKLWAEFANNRP